MLNIAHYGRNANQIYNEISPHTSQNGLLVSGFLPHVYFKYQANTNLHFTSHIQTHIQTIRYIYLKEAIYTQCSEFFFFHLTTVWGHFST